MRIVVRRGVAALLLVGGAVAPPATLFSADTDAPPGVDGLCLDVLGFEILCPEQPTPTPLPPSAESLSDEPVPPPVTPSEPVAPPPAPQPDPVPVEPLPTLQPSVSPTTAPVPSTATAATPRSDPALTAAAAETSAAPLAVGAVTLTTGGMLGLAALVGLRRRWVTVPERR